jgi:hypothetical protein
LKEKKQSAQTSTREPKLKLSLDNVPVDGALGLLAYGDIGLKAWRDKRTEVEGPDWRNKLAIELKAEEALEKSTDGGN